MTFGPSFINVCLSVCALFPFPPSSLLLSYFPFPPAFSSLSACYFPPSFVCLTFFFFAVYMLSLALPPSLPSSPSPSISLPSNFVCCYLALGGREGRRDSPI
jgi:hypothetical protein